MAPALCPFLLLIYVINNSIKYSFDFQSSMCHFTKGGSNKDDTGRSQAPVSYYQQLSSYFGIPGIGKLSTIYLIYQTALQCFYYHMLPVYNPQ